MMQLTPPGAIVQVIFRDNSGCSHYRLRYNTAFLSASDPGITPILLPNPILDANWLAGTRAIYWQRPVSDQDIQILTQLKAAQPKFGYRLVGEFDDLSWISHGQFIPEYNMASLNINGEGLTKNLAKALPLLDEVTVTNEWLKKSLEDTFDYKNVRVVPNVIPRYLWSMDRKKDITEDIKVPTILYSGAPQHYRNPIPKCPQFPNGVEPHKGDWTDGWIDWVIKSVRSGKIKLCVMGALPFFFEPIKDMITFIPWVDCMSFPRTVMSLHPDFLIAPLAENEFNRCKSDLRFIESCAVGAPLLGTFFIDGPYEHIHSDCRVPLDVTTEWLDDKLAALCKKEKYNEIKNWQYDYLNGAGRWLESSRHVNNLVSAFDNSQTLNPLI